MTTELNAMQARAALVRERLPEHLDRLGWSTERIAAHQRDALRRLLRTAIDHSPFHAARLHGVEPERFELSDLVSLPIMTKAEMIAAYDDTPNGLDARARITPHKRTPRGWPRATRGRRRRHGTQRTHPPPRDRKDTPVHPTTDLMAAGLDGLRAVRAVADQGEWA